MDARGANTFLSHNQLPNLNQGFSDIFLSPHGINKHRWRLHCMKNGSDFPARYSWRLHWGLLRVKPSLVGLFVCLLFPGLQYLALSFIFLSIISAWIGCFSSSTPSFIFLLPLWRGYCEKLYTRA